MQLQPAGKMKVLAQIVCEDIVGNGMDYEKLQSVSSDILEVKSDLKAAVAAVRFMLHNAGRE
jgi:hypothetical protein